MKTLIKENNSTGEKFEYRLGVVLGFGLGIGCVVGCIFTSEVGMGVGLIVAGGSLISVSLIADAADPFADEDYWIEPE